MPSKKYFVKLLVVLCVFFFIDKAISHALQSHYFYLPYVHRAYPPPTPTRTPLPSPTATVTPTPFPTPTPLPTPSEFGEVAVIDGRNYVDWLGDTSSSWVYVGEVYNGTTQRAEIGSVWLAAYDHRGRVIGGGSAMAWPHILEPGGRGCFKIWYQTSEWFYSELTTDVTHYSGGRQLGVGLAILDHQLVFENDLWRVKGHIQNNRDGRVRSPYLVGAAYDGRGRVIGCDMWTFDELPAGATRHFDLYHWVFGNPERNTEIGSKIAIYRLDVADIGPNDIPN